MEEKYMNMKMKKKVNINIFNFLMQIKKSLNTKIIEESSKDLY